MNGAFYVGAVGLQSQQRALDIIAANIANSNTPAFKRSEIRFSNILATRDARADDSVDAAPLDAGVTVRSAVMTNEPGQLQTTGAAMDIAIDGQGFIELLGPGGQTLLWRGGTLRIGDDGLLAAANGMALKAAITVPEDAAAITIGSDGTVRANAVDGDAPVELGRIQLVKIDDSAALQPLEGGLYRANDVARAIDAAPGEDGAGMLIQGALERSNVEMTTEMVQLMLVQRAYGANAQILQAADQLMAIANGLRR